MTNAMERLQIRMETLAHLAMEFARDEQPMHPVVAGCLGMMAGLTYAMRDIGHVREPAPQPRAEPERQTSISADSLNEVAGAVAEKLPTVLPESTPEPAPVAQPPKEKKPLSEARLAACRANVQKAQARRQEKLAATRSAEPPAVVPEAAPEPAPPPAPAPAPVAPVPAPAAAVLPPVPAAPSARPAAVPAPAPQPAADPEAKARAMLREGFAESRVARDTGLALDRVERISREIARVTQAGETGTRKQAEELVDLGWNGREIAEELGLPLDTAARWVSDYRARKQRGAAA
ncbi:MAG: hypothetical protein E7K72_11820 [Roseomonas mucosa]|nr:hypothetical protein [Roseomonas mucosa]